MVADRHRRAWFHGFPCVSRVASLLRREDHSLFPFPNMSTAEKTLFRCISASEAISLMRGEPPAIIFDVRDMASYQEAHVDGAAHLSEDRLLAWMKRLPKDAPVVIYCYHGNASKVFAQMFVDFRYSNVFSVDGGYEPLAAALGASLAA
jgi:rhodanese-related sulfurtransferase